MLIITLIQGLWSFQSICYLGKMKYDRQNISLFCRTKKKWPNELGIRLLVDIF